MRMSGHFDGATAFTARFDVDIEDALEALRPRHGRPTFGGRLVLRLTRRFGLFAFAPLCRRHHTRCLLLGALTQPWMEEVERSTTARTQEVEMDGLPQVLRLI